MKKTLQTVCIIRHQGRVLLGRNKRGISVGKWTGPGGHVEEGETIEKAAIREMKEEAGLDVSDVKKVGILSFTSPLRSPIEIHIFKATKYEGEPMETDEMSPEWFTKDTIPFREMWTSDLYWWPYFFKNRLFVGEFEYDKHDRVISHEVRAVDTPSEMEHFSISRGKLPA